MYANVLYKITTHTTVFIKQQLITTSFTSWLPSYTPPPKNTIFLILWWSRLYSEIQFCCFVLILHRINMLLYKNIFSCISTFQRTTIRRIQLKSTNWQAVKEHAINISVLSSTRICPLKKIKLNYSLIKSSEIRAKKWRC